MYVYNLQVLKTLCLIADTHRIEWSVLPVDTPCADVEEHIAVAYLQSKSGILSLREALDGVDTFTLLMKTRDYSLANIQATTTGLTPLLDRVLEEKHDSLPLVQEEIYGLGVSGIYREIDLGDWVEVLPQLVRGAKKHYFTHFLTEISLRSQKQGVHLQFHDGFIAVLSIKAGVVGFFNTFDYYSVDEAVYFTLLAFHNTLLEVEKDTLWLSGSIAKGSQLYVSLKKYIRNVEFLHVPEFASDDYHKYWDHISVHKMNRLILQYADH